MRVLCQFANSSSSHVPVVHYTLLRKIYKNEQIFSSLLFLIYLQLHKSKSPSKQQTHKKVQEKNKSKFHPVQHATFKYFYIII